jgi:hypothetical protein
MDKGTSAGGRPRTEKWLELYRPLRVTPDVWVVARPFVVESATGLGLAGGAGAMRVVRVLARLAAWAVGEGLALDPDVVLDPDTVERFIAEHSSESDHLFRLKATARSG